ncbi:MAG: hypothetical protein OXI70_13315 [Chloroflexota bacterium]|nr:hypothetical protein [Chloroflexota bacterium]MDE2868980.1 hypothetical protein [Chloroflexota bacterium]
MPKSPTLVYRWSAVPRPKAWRKARRTVYEFLQFAAVSLDWPLGHVMVGRGGGHPSLIVEFPFRRTADFEAAWDRMSTDPHSEALWSRLAPLLHDSTIRRELFAVQYARVGTTDL